MNLKKMRVSNFRISISLFSLGLQTFKCQLSVGFCSGGWCFITKMLEAIPADIAYRKRWVSGKSGPDISGRGEESNNGCIFPRVSCDMFSKSIGLCSGHPPHERKQNKSFGTSRVFVPEGIPIVGNPY